MYFPLGKRTIDPSWYCVVSEIGHGPFESKPHVLWALRALRHRQITESCPGKNKPKPVLWSVLGVSGPRADPILLPPKI